MDLRDKIRNIQDFPQEGVLFRDITTLLKDAEGMKEAIDQMTAKLEGVDFDLVLGPESRGFILGGALAARLGAGFVMARKPGKLPAETIEETYAKEYGTDCIQIHKDAIDENDVVLLHDDLLATGGTMAATYRLVQTCHPKQTFINFVIELEELNGRKAFPEEVEVETLLKL